MSVSVSCSRKYKLQQELLVSKPHEKRSSLRKLKDRGDVTSVHVILSLIVARNKEQKKFNSTMDGLNCFIFNCEVTQSSVSHILRLWQGGGDGYKYFWLVCCKIFFDIY